MSALFSELRMRDVVFKNRIFVSPMCQYSSSDGLANSWHMVHLGSRAVGGAALILTEAAAASPEGRISPNDLGLWNKEQAEALLPITDFVKSQGCQIGVQLAHAGRKASTFSPWLGHGSVPTADGGWATVAPRAQAFDKDYAAPREMKTSDFQKVLEDFKRSTRLSLLAGFNVIELHMAHGYLFHEFLSPLTNLRSDTYGGSLENRMRFPLQVAEAVRAEWPVGLPLFVRISASDWVDGGWDVEQSCEFARRLKVLGVDLIDCSSGGAVPKASIPVMPGYQVPFAGAIRNRVEIATGAVGLITDPQQAEEIIAGHHADVVLLARELLRDPYWPLHAAQALKVQVPWPKPYERAAPRPEK